MVQDTRNPNNIFISCENISRIFQIFDLALGKSEKHLKKSGKLPKYSN
jgi:hypothetical protein